MRGDSIQRYALGSWVFLILLLFLPSSASAYDPELRFSTIETDHFNIHYHQGLEHEARLAAGICEEVYEDLTILFGWAVSKKTEVVITDNTDGANGSASALGRPVVRLNATAPSLESTLQTQDHYLRSLILHEYVHIVHLSIRGRFQDVINTVFGDVYLPNQMAPRWFVEGLAVLLETERSTAGRIRSSLYRMYLRADALGDRLQTLGQLSNATRDFLRGSKQYLYGAMFLDYVMRKHSLEQLIEIAHKYGNAVIPYGLNRMFLETFGQDLVSLYAEWLRAVERETDALREQLIEQDLTPSRALTTDGEYKGRPVFAPDDKSVFLSISNGDHEGAVFRFPLDGSKPKNLFLSYGETYLTQDRSGRIFYSRGAPVTAYYRFNDVFMYDPARPGPRRITTGLRAIYAAVNPRGDRLAVASKDAGTSDLLLTDEEGNRLATLIDSPLHDQVYHPCWSPDGKQIAVVVRKGVQVDLELLDMSSGHRRKITDDRFLELAPTFDATGRYLLFSSNRSGIDNIYAYDLREERLLQLTNVLTGAFSPAVSNDGKTLAFLKYSTFGYDLHVMPFDPEHASEPMPFAFEWKEPKPLPAPSQAQSERYNPFPTFVPTHWMLNTMLDTDWNVTLKATTAFQDVANRHNLGVELQYLTEDHELGGQLGYSYQGLGPALRLGLSRQFVRRGDGFTVNGQKKEWIQIVTRGSARFSFNIPGVDDAHGLSVGYSVVHGKTKDELSFLYDPRQPMPAVPTEYFRAGFSLGWSFSDTVAHPLGIGTHKGRTLSADVDFYHPTLGGTGTLATFRYSWTEYVSMPWLRYHVLVLGFRGGVHVSNPPDEAGFVVGGYAEQNVVDAIINGTSPGAPSLRGYPNNAFSGSMFQSIRLQYRFPIWYPELAYATLPLFLRRIQGSLFTDNVIISYDELTREDWRSSLGAEIFWIFHIGYYSVLTLRTGYAYGFMKKGTHEVILVVSGGF